MRFKGLTSFNEICFSCFTFTVTIRFIEFKRNQWHVSSVLIVTQKCSDTVVGLELLVRSSVARGSGTSVLSRWSFPYYLEFPQLLEFRSFPGLNCKFVLVTSPERHGAPPVHVDILWARHVIFLPYGGKVA